MALSTLTTKGQITIPKVIRDYLNVDSGDKIEFIIDDEGQVIMASKTLSVQDIAGMIEKKKGVSIGDMNKAISKTLLRKTRASKSRFKTRRFISKSDQNKDNHARDRH